MKEIYYNGLHATEKAYKYIKKYQDLNRGSRYYGSYIIPGKGYAESSHLGDAKGINIMLSLYCCRESTCYLEPELLDRSILMLDSILNNQNPDGTLNQTASNFNSTPDSAFAVNIIFPVYELLRGLCLENEKAELLQRKITLFLERSSETFLTGGFHTPNHRWIIANALVNTYKLKNEEKYLMKAREYLAEGIDINTDGEYSEKSIGKYDAMVNDALLNIAGIINKEEILNIVHKNLDLLRHFIQPDGTIYTAGSKRQDQNSKNYPVKYLKNLMEVYFNTREESLLGQIKGIGKRIRSINDKGLEYNILDYFLLNRGFFEIQTQSREITEKRYEKWYKDTGFVRAKRRDNEVITINEENSNFMNIQIGDLNIDFNFTNSFFGRGAFKGKISRIEGGYRLSQNVKYGYIKPMKTNTHEWHNIDQGDWCDIDKFNNKYTYPDWDDIDHGGRDTCNEIELRTDIDIVLSEEGLALRIKSSGIKNVISRLDMVLDANGILHSDNFVMSGNPGGSIFLNWGDFDYSKGLDRLSFGRKEQTEEIHHCSNIRGGNEVDTGRFTVSFSSVSEVEQEIILYRS